MKKFETLIVVVILILAFTLRLYKLNNPIADWHSWRQADTAAVARNFVKDHFNILYPQSDSLTPLNEYGLQNPNRYFINEFPLYNSLVAILYGIFGINPALARLLSIFFATVGTLFLYLLAKRLFGLKVAILAAFFYATNPFNIYYGRVVMPDPMYIAFSIISLYFFLNWVASKKITSVILSSVFLSLAILVKPYAIFLFVPITYWLVVNWGLSFWKNKQVIVFLTISLLPFLLWRIHVFNHPEGTFATTWLYNTGNIRFTGAFFRWLIFERLNRLIFATGAFVLLVIGLTKSYTTKNGSLISMWLLSVILYMIVFAKGNVTHDYYQLPLMAPGSILVAMGVFAMVNFSQKTYVKFLNSAIACFLLILSFAFGWYEVRGFYNINHPEIVAAGQAADKLLPNTAIVIAPYDDDPTFLYQTNRFGYTKIDRPISKFLDAGAQYLVSVNPNDSQISSLTKNCDVLEKSPEYVIIKLNVNCIK